VAPVGPEEFERLVGEALDSLPDELARHFDNVLVVVEDENGDEPGLLGLYEGVPLTERADYWGVLPDRVSVYRVPLCRVAADLDELRDEIRTTVVHEMAHHVGLDDARLTELGWD
jgi:predicted Zn-dependent protease with MMP-like domain